MGWKKITLLSCLASGVIFWLGTDYIMNKGTKPKQMVKATMLSY